MRGTDYSVAKAILLRHKIESEMSTAVRCGLL